MKHYFAEVTDTFGGEANYCWVRRYKIKASTPTGAIRKVPGSWRKTADFGDMQRYDCGNTCCFLEEWDEGSHAHSKVEEI